MTEKKDLAIFGGRPVRGKNNPLPDVFPRKIDDSALTYIREVIDSGFTSDMEARFQRAFAKACGVKHAVAVTNCTAAVHAALGALDLGPGDEVVVSPISDYGSVAGVIAQNAIPVFPDVDIRNGCVTAEEIKKALTPKTMAMVIVHWYGLTCDMDPIMDLARDRSIVVIEDCCQNPLGDYKGRKAGSMGDMGCFSFDAEKHLSAEHGGAVVTNSEELANKVRKFALLRGAENFPRYGRKHVSFGLNYRFGSLLSAVALAQLELLPQQNERRVELAQMLNEKLEEVDGLIPVYVPPGCSHLYWLYALQLDLSKFKAGIWEVGDALKGEGIPCSPAPYYLLPDCVTFLSERYGIKYGAHLVPKAKAHLDRTIRWAWTDKYTEKDINDITRAIEKVLNCYHI